MIRLLALLIFGLVCFIAGAVYEAIRDGGTLDMHTALMATKRRADVLQAQASRRLAPVGRRADRAGGRPQGEGGRPPVQAGGVWL